MYIWRGNLTLRLPTLLVFAFSVKGSPLQRIVAALDPFDPSDRHAQNPLIVASSDNAFARSIEPDDPSDRHVQKPPILDAANDLFSTLNPPPPPPPPPPPTPMPSSYPTPRPSLEPTPLPSSEPTPRPSSEPTSRPSPEPTSHPSSKPTSPESSMPTSRPTLSPTALPSFQPTTSSPTEEPTPRPTPSPSATPTFRPTTSPPTKRPTSLPTADPCILSGDSFGEKGGTPIFVTYGYEIETDRAITKSDMQFNILPKIEAAINNELLPEFFVACAVKKRLRQLTSPHARRLSEVIGISSFPLDQVVNATCQNTPETGNYCTVAEGVVTLFLSGQETNERNEVQNAIRSNMYPRTTFNSVDRRIEHIFFVVPNQPAPVEEDNTGTADILTDEGSNEEQGGISRIPFIIAGSILAFCIIYAFIAKGVRDLNRDEDSYDGESWVDAPALLEKMPVHFGSYVPNAPELKEGEGGSYGDRLEHSRRGDQYKDDWGEGDAEDYEWDQHEEAHEHYAGSRRGTSFQDYNDDRLMNPSASQRMA